MEQRQSRGWTTAKMARAELERLGGIRIAESVYAEWEAGSRQPSAANLARLETFYGTSPSQSGAPDDLASALREFTAELRAMREERQALFDRLAGLEARPAFDPETLEQVRQLAESDEVRRLLRSRASRPGMPTG